MNDLRITYLIVAIIMFTTSAFTKEKGLTLDDLASHMKIDLQLTDEQVKLIKPIVLKYAHKRQDYLQNMQGALTLNKSKAKSDLKKIQREENQELSQILTPEQMQKRIAKQNLKNSLNQDNTFDFENENDEVTLTPQGGSMQF